MSRSHRKLPLILLSCLLLLGIQSMAFAQGGEHDGDRVRGRITSITGNTIDITRRDGSAASIVTTGNTTFVRNGQPATLDAFQEGDRINAHGSQNGNGAFVADAVRGTNRPPHSQADRVGGVVASVDVAQSAITVTTEAGATAVIYATPQTQIVRNRQPATVADFVAGDRVRARGERDPNDQFIAERILGGSGPAH